MVSKGRKIMWIASAFLLLGIGLIGFSEWAQIQGKYPSDSLTHLLLNFLRELGIASAIGSIVAIIIEWSLSEQHLNKIIRLLGHHHDIEEAGLQNVYSNRQKFFDDLFKSILHNVRHDLKIMGICISLFREADRPERIGEWSMERPVKFLFEVIQKGCNIKVLFLKRYPTVDELRQYGISQGADFFHMRERDEDYDQNFFGGKRLKKIANTSMGYWIKLLIELARSMQDDKTEKRREVLSRLQIREYISLPSLSLYIADEEIYVTPYLCKRHCSTVPTFKVTGKDTPLYISYNGHFDATWADQNFTTPAIDKNFIQLLIDKPTETLELYKRKYTELMEKEKVEVSQNLGRLEDPEHYRTEEKAIEAVLAAIKPSSDE